MLLPCRRHAALLLYTAAATTYCHAAADYTHAADTQRLSHISRRRFLLISPYARCRLLRCHADAMILMLLPLR